MQVSRASSFKNSLPQLSAESRHDRKRRFIGILALKCYIVYLVQKGLPYLIAMRDINLEGNNIACLLHKQKKNSMRFLKILGRKQGSCRNLVQEKSTKIFSKNKSLFLGEVKR